MPIIGPVIGAIGAIGGGLLASGASSDAANTAAQASTQNNAAAIAEQDKQYTQTRGDLMPWMSAGQSALGQQGDLLGINGNPAQSAAIAQLKASPLYQSLFTNGQNTLLANASATGGLRGGNTQNSLAQFGSDTLAQVIQSQLGNLNNLSVTGQDSAAKTGALGQASASTIAQLLNNTGAVQGNAAYVVGGANAGLANTIGGSLASLGNNAAIQRALFGSPPLGSGGIVAPGPSLVSDAGSTIASNPRIF